MPFSTRFSGQLTLTASRLLTEAFTLDNLAFDAKFEGELWRVSKDAIAYRKDVVLNGVNVILKVTLTDEADGRCRRSAQNPDAADMALAALFHVDVQITRSPIELKFSSDEVDAGAKLGKAKGTALDLTTGGVKLVGTGQFQEGLLGGVRCLAVLQGSFSPLPQLP